MSVLPRETLVVAGHTVALTYDDASREYAALHEACGALHRDERARWTFAGKEASGALAGLVTNDVDALVSGAGCYAAALTAKGRIVADVRILRRDTDFLVDVASRASSGWQEHVRKYVNPRLAKYADITAATGCVGAYGPRAAATVARISDADANALAQLPPYHHVAARIAGHDARILRSPDFGVPGFDILVSAEASATVFEMLIDAGARAVGLAAADIVRVEAGRPEWGIDMDDATIPQEANLESLHAISYTKGCYTGQEVVARVHFRGHVNRTLRGLAGDLPIPPRAPLVALERNEIGDVRSSVVSPRFGPIALAMLRREVSIGDEVFVRDGDHEHAVRVVQLPF
ncbi:MAG TPA: glycine cleavage T C-terminal barrel domain-containing protein [Gemmatimonadaceae bacterium]|nr:glycine cleavage T C-terminal barrel domain-containing protein [Gemmatimonadaceae bacterium]